MKRITLLIITFFIVTLCSVAGGVLLSGCSNKDDNSNEIGGNATSGYRIYFDLNYDNIPVNYFDPYYVENMEPLAYYVENGHYQSLAARACAYREYDGIYGVRQFVAFEIFSYTFLRLWYLAYHKRAVGKFADRAFCRSVCGSQQPTYEDG